jgi:hypothetical protein
MISECHPNQKYSSDLRSREETIPGRRTQALVHSSDYPESKSITALVTNIAMIAAHSTTLILLKAMIIEEA